MKVLGITVLVLVLLLLNAWLWLTLAPPLPQLVTVAMIGAFFLSRRQ